MSLLSEEDSLLGRSWVEICDDELSDEENTSSPTQTNESIEEGEIRDNSIVENTNNTDIVNASIEEGEIDDSRVLNTNDAELNTSIKESELRDVAIVDSTTEVEGETKENSRVNTTDSDVANASIEEGEIRDSSFIQAKNDTTPRKVNEFSYAKVVRGLKSDANKSVSNDDLSLTSHLDVFHVDSPQKDVDVKNTDCEIEIMLNEDTVMFSPCKKEENPTRNMKRPFMLIDSPVQKPRGGSSIFSKIHKIAKSMPGDDVHSTTNDEIETQSNDDGVDRSVSSPSSKRELEVNPEILSRRQKQIDYGKNTEGYDRYIKAIPKHERTKEHPKTPPKHLKMSRRAWDGLVKNWRLKLHKWDSMNENEEFDSENGNFDQFSFSSEDPSSYDSSSVRSDSTPSTPKQRTSVTESEDANDQWACNNGTSKSENSKELWSQYPKKTNKSDDDEFLGCEPLSENCVKACS